MDLRAELQDEARPLFNRIITEKPQWLGSAMKSAGYWAQQELKKGIRSGAPGGRQYRALMPAYLRSKLEGVVSGKAKRTYKPLGDLVQAVGYDKSRAREGIVTTGWLSASAVRIGTKQEKGFITAVTDKLRNAFHAAGLKIGENKTQITIQALPTYQPMHPLIEKGAPERVQAKIADYINGATQRSAASSKRVYRVYS
ncbi:MAG: hypothetical protein K0Q85_26 [Caproiciproducens sp.]|jgi:hypothetical protein|nr:hypothetical protein [Caproiciproducens sp.]